MTQNKKQDDKINTYTHRPMIQLLRFLAFIFLSASVCSTTYGQLKDDYSAKIDSLLQTTAPRSFNGVVLITKKGKIAYSRAFGYSDFEHKIPLKITDKFRIQSNSKQITAVLILREVDKGNLSLEVPVKKYLPHITQSWADTVTLHHLLNFSSGITDIDQPLNFIPGTDFLYNVISYSMLGQVIEKVTGRTYIDAATDLFDELDMNNSFCYEEHKMQNRLVNGYTSADNIFKLREHPVQREGWIDFIPAGGIVSNLQDLNNWDIKLHHGKILKPETYKLMTSYSITAQHEAFGTARIGYGYGVYVNDKTPVKYIGHPEKGLGFASLKIYFPEKDVDMIVLENQYSDDSNLHYYFENKVREIVMNSNLLNE